MWSQTGHTNSFKQWVNKLNGGEECQNRKLVEGEVHWINYWLWAISAVLKRKKWAVLQNRLKVFIINCFSFNLTTLRCFWLLFHGNVDHPDFRNNPHWFLPDPNNAPVVFVFCTNSRSKEACWAFEEQPRQPFKTIFQGMQPWSQLV